MLALPLATGVASGVALGGLAADARRHDGVLVWHLPVGVVVVALPVIVFAEAIYLGLSCTS